MDRAAAHLTSPSILPHRRGLKFFGRRAAISRSKERAVDVALQRDRPAARVFGSKLRANKQWCTAKGSLV
jgi:hypothetical protein